MMEIVVRHIGSDSSGNLIDGTVFTLNTNVVACAIRIQKNSGKLYNSIIIPSQLSVYLNNPQGNNSSSFPIIEYKLYLNPTGGLTYTWNTHGLHIQLNTQIVLVLLNMH